jgi:hypothetical protein
MKTLEDILTAVERLSPHALHRLRKHLDRVEARLWEKELTKTSAEIKRRGITDHQIDRAVLRRRRESRR